MINIKKNDITRIATRNAGKCDFRDRSGWLVISSRLTLNESHFYRDRPRVIAEKTSATTASTKASPRKPPPPVVSPKANAHGWLVWLTLSYPSESQYYTSSPAATCFGTLGMPWSVQSLPIRPDFRTPWKASLVLGLSKVASKVQTFSLLFLPSAIFNSLFYPLYKISIYFFPQWKQIEKTLDFGRNFGQYTVLTYKFFDCQNASNNQTLDSLPLKNKNRAVGAVQKNSAKFYLKY
jgi:hypothetical protein